MKARSESAREKIREMVEYPHLHSSKEERNLLSPTEIEYMHTNALRSDPSLERSENQWLRQAWGWSRNGNAYVPKTVADPSEYYDSWAQAYRMLGVFISCDEDENDRRENKNFRNLNENDDEGDCNRWVMWASVSTAIVEP